MKQGDFFIATRDAGRWAWLEERAAESPVSWLFGFKSEGSVHILFSWLIVFGVLQATDGQAKWDRTWYRDGPPRNVRVSRITKLGKIQ